MASSSASGSPVLSSSSASSLTPDVELEIYDSRPRYELAFDADGITLSYPVAPGTKLRELQWKFDKASISIEYNGLTIIEGKLWAPLSEQPEASFEEDVVKGRILVVPFQIPRGSRWPALIRGPRTASLNTIDPWSAYQLGLQLSRPDHPFSARPAEGLPMLQYAAKNGVAEAQFHLAQIYSDPIQAAVLGEAENQRLALSYFLAVAKTLKIGQYSQLTYAQIGEAQFRLGQAHEIGHAGVKQSMESAILWYSRARLNESHEANERLAQIEAEDLSNADIDEPSLRKAPRINKGGISFWHVAGAIALGCVAAGIAYEIVQKKKDA